MPSQWEAWLHQAITLLRRGARKGKSMDSTISAIGSSQKPRTGSQLKHQPISNTIPRPMRRNLLLGKGILFPAKCASILFITSQNIDARHHNKRFEGQEAAVFRMRMPCAKTHGFGIWRDTEQESVVTLGGRCKIMDLTYLTSQIQQIWHNNSEFLQNSPKQQRKEYK